MNLVEYLADNIMTITSLLMLLMLIFLVKFWSRQQSRKRGTLTLDKSVGLVPYLVCLTQQPSTCEKLLRSSPFHHIYIAQLPGTIDNIIRIREPWLKSTYELLEFDLVIGQLSTFKLTLGLKRYLFHSNFNTPESIDIILHVIRAVGFFHQHKVPLTLDWDHPTLMSHLARVGRVLPLSQYLVYATLPSYHNPKLSFELQIRGIFKRLPNEALKRLEIAKDRARDRLAMAKEQLSMSFANLLDVFDQEEEDSTVKCSVLNDANIELLSELELHLFWIKRKVSGALMKCLETLPLSLQENLKNPILLIANNYRKRITPKDISPDFYNQFHRVVTACKLGIRVNILNGNNDFFKFAFRNAIHRYLLMFNHAIRVDEDTARIWILYEGSYEPWDQVKLKLNRDEKDPDVITGLYTERGLVNKGLYDWTVLEPFMHLVPVNATVDPNNASTGLPASMRHDWGNRYLLEFCSWILEKPRIGGDHMWLRLKTPQGHVYSMGQYRPKKFGFHEQFIFPMKIKTCVFCSPDLCEFWTGPYTTLSIEITEKQFLEMKTLIEKDQVAKEHIYQLFNGNCVNYAMQVAELADIQFPTQLHLFDLLMTDKVKSVTGRVSTYLPKSIRDLGTTVFAFTLNWFFILLGAGFVDKEVKRDPKFSHIEPFIKSLGDLTDTNKVIANHPYVIGEYVRKDVQTWRDSKMSEIRAKMSLLKQSEADYKEAFVFLQDQMERFRYALPQRYRLSSYQESRPNSRASSFDEFRDRWSNEE